MHIPWSRYSNCPTDSEQFMPNYCYTNCEANATDADAADYIL